ncbi:four helix bundle protein [Natronoflexus pectinivorans]|uniref:Four helix bundle protein n=1 Tax=Natronoflexus pectinivorans TaxID=682526 RepID=A0A4R2GNU8_9BACT|nr:four helix bundle protein [Natronoflexus pectinivorans]TCO09375.1 four helix bundle protein [Natronoflexus pectinivorans]
MNNRIEKFEDLQIWQNSVDLSVKLYTRLKNCRDYGLRDQIQRSAVSIPSNIAEGFDRNSNKEFIRFLRIAKGSCAELRTQLIIAERINLFETINLIEETQKLSAMIQKMINYRESLEKQ